MKLQAINAIYRVENKKQVRVDPGKIFDCPGTADDPESEAGGYILQKAARVPPEDKKPAAKPVAKPAAKKPATKKPTAAEKKAATAAAAKDGDKTGTDELLD
jgi:hypothetical protein